MVGAGSKVVLLMTLDRLICGKRSSWPGLVWIAIVLCPAGVVVIGVNGSTLARCLIFWHRWHFRLHAGHCCRPPWWRPEPHLVHVLLGWGGMGLCWCWMAWTCMPLWVMLFMSARCFLAASCTLHLIRISWMTGLFLQEVFHRVAI